MPKAKIEEFAISVDPDEAALNEPPHLDLHCFLSYFEFYIYLEQGIFLKFCRRKFCRLLFGANIQMHYNLKKKKGCIPCPMAARLRIITENNAFMAVLVRRR